MLWTRALHNGNDCLVLSLEWLEQVDPAGKRFSKDEWSVTVIPCRRWFEIDAYLSTDEMRELHELVTVVERTSDFETIVTWLKEQGKYRGKEA